MARSVKGFLAKLENDLSRETYTAALERGQELDLEDAVAVLIEANDAKRFSVLVWKFVQERRSGALFRIQQQEYIWSGASDV